MYKILIFDRTGKTRPTLTSALEDRANFTSIATETEFQEEIKSKQFDLIFLDNDSINGRAVKILENMRSKDPYLPIIMTSETEKAEMIVQAMNSGASDYLVHPISPTRVNISFDKAIEIRDQRFEIAYHRRKQDVVYDFKDVVAFSPKMKAILVSLERFAKTDSTILITGDTGTGKSFLSGTVHFNSPRRKKPFVKINCANIPEDLLESELFGHEKGAFTGADKQRIGRFEQASGGTIFLDEIGEMNLSLQTKLLRVLEEKSFERVGGNKTIYSDVRIIAATNKDLVQQVADGLFREDLYYRINVLPVTLPSLKERQDCLLPLAELLLNKCCTSMHREIVGFTENSTKKIQEYDWPGNIRQLANTIERAVILEDGKYIHAENLALPVTVARSKGSANSNVDADNGELQEGALDGSLAGQEKELILRVLEECLWVQKNAALKLGVSPRALNYKINKLGITHPHWRRNKRSV
ncbi:sigma-54 dependent transcriptional regulator [Desulforhopalus sp. IMCC35007]|uniref:sigma-54-dependent transcriptional regulator n=1 Tax=Desulforhopalus sp. IMCC35007 TaxID=2569543 RepID=UPI0010AE002F|nr:sigma-54 dependent transcriptional regulator [Desulforhopalus sp. IMCC35007]TKB07160.1 sigma-54-dependent Fis family transcriptional regulator [Desulforhopalus sp. IMCC35007]